MRHQHQMTIPSQLRLFLEPTALICLARDRAKVYRVCDATLSELAFWHSRDTDYQYSDQESFSHAEGSRTIFFRPGTEEHNKEHYLTVFLHYFVDQLKKLQAQHSFHELYLFVPKEIRFQLQEKLSTELRKKTHLLLGNVMYLHPLELLKRIEADSEDA